MGAHMFADVNGITAVAIVIKRFLTGYNQLSNV